MKVQEEKDAILLQESGAYQEEIQEQMLQARDPSIFRMGPTTKGNSIRGKCMARVTSIGPGENNMLENSATANGRDRDVI